MEAQIETPLEIAKKLSEELGNTLLLKREDLQAARSQSLIRCLMTVPFRHVSARELGFPFHACIGHGKAVGVLSQSNGFDLRIEAGKAVLVLQRFERQPPLRPENPELSSLAACACRSSLSRCAEPSTSWPT